MTFSALTKLNQLDRALPLSSVPVTQSVRCPTCGSFAERRVLRNPRGPLAGEDVIRTACDACDYLMVTGSLTGRVIEAHGW